ncbi:unnamed protein product [Mycena citricolor]|uniref:Uncharacterized protein n=1 Tax=Mycena citricolor TaxID=2018698 RepID=A0AAD2H4C8_9AGAR|nr:unnamed protein product [Mycena citricolor]
MPDAPTSHIQYIRPSATLFGSMPRTSKDVNPHIQTLAERPIPTNNKNGAAPFQRVPADTFPNHVVSAERLFLGVHESQKEQLLEMGETIIPIIIALGGQTLTYKLRDSLSKEVMLAISGILNDSPAEFITATPATPLKSGKDKYAEPVTAFIRIEDKEKREAVLAEKLIAVNTSIAFWPKKIDGQRSWTVLHAACSSLKNPEQMENELAAAVRELMHTNPPISQLIDRMTQPMTGNREQRIDESIGLSVHAVFKTNDIKPYITVYANPDAGSEEDQRTLRRLLRSNSVITGAVEYTPSTHENGDIKACVICKQDNHPSYACEYPKKQWWGPQDQMSGLPDEHPLATRGNTGNRRNHGGWPSHDLDGRNGRYGNTQGRKRGGGSRTNYGNRNRNRAGRYNEGSHA